MQGFEAEFFQLAVRAIMQVHRDAGVQHVATADII